MSGHYAPAGFGLLFGGKDKV